MDGCFTQLSFELNGVGDHKTNRGGTVPPMNAGSKKSLAFLKIPIMATGMLALLVALAGGLSRMGYFIPGIPSRFAFQHGGLMVSSFLGTVIAMERAVALPLRGSLLVPLTAALGTLGLLLGNPGNLGILLLVLASLGLLVLFGSIFRTQPALHGLVLLAGGVCWLVGNVSWWASVPVHRFVAWWMGFLVLVIAAERLELNRLLRPQFLQKAVFAGGILLVVLGPFPWIPPSAGSRLFALGLIVIAAWLFSQDMVTRTLTLGGQRQYTGWCLTTGYFWLGLGGIIRFLYPVAGAGYPYDAFLHSVFVGFVFTMILGHAFLILPGVMGVQPTFHRGFYLPLVLLEASLAVRVGADLLHLSHGRQLGGLVNTLAILLFAGMLVDSVVRPGSSPDPA